MRATLWIFLAIAGSLPLLALFLMSMSLETFLSRGNADLAASVQVWLLVAIPPTLILWLLCMVLANDFGQRPAEYWLRVWARHRALPKRLEDSALRKHHSALSNIPRGCVEIVGPTNLRMSDEATLSSNIKRLGVFFNGLRFPVQIIVRAWPTEDGLIERRWFVAMTASTEAVLTANVQAVIDGLNRAGLRGHAKNGDLFDTLHACWTNKPLLKDQVGPQRIDRDVRYVVVDGEYVRGFLMARYPRTVDANWLAPLLDGDEAFDFSLWLDPTDNADERDYLASRIVMWQTAQVLNTNQGIPLNPDIEDQINDAKRTRLLIQRRELRVFRATVAFIVRGKTYAEMTERESLLRDQLRECVGDEALIPLDYEHDRVPLMAVPTGEPAIEYPLRTVTPAVARGYPFSNSSVSQPGGVNVGTSVGSKRTNKVNPFSVANPHMLVLGTTGAGKGFWVKVFLWRLLQAHPDLVVFIIQAEKDEYSALSEAMPNLPYAEHRADAVFSMEQPQPLELMRARKWAKGSSSTGLVIRITGLDQMDCIYNYKPTHRLETRRLTVYDLTPMPPADRGQAIANLLLAIEQDSSRSSAHPHGLVVIDELGIVLESDAAALAIETAYRRFRSIPQVRNPREVVRRGMLGISQRPSDLLTHPRGKVLADLALTHVYFRQKSTELKRVAVGLGLSEDEQRFLDEQCDEGTGLLIADRARVGFHLYATDLETNLART